MPIISLVGRKERRLRVLIVSLYVILTIGAITMVYPFMLMVSISFTSPSDMNEFRPIPRYWYDDSVLFRKYVEAKYNEDIVLYNAWFGEDWASFEKVTPPERVNAKLVWAWRDFCKTLPQDHLMLAHSNSLSRITPEIVYQYRKFLQNRFSGDLEELNARYHEVNENWMELLPPMEIWTLRGYVPEPTLKYREYLDFKRELHRRYLFATPVDGLYQEYLRQSYGAIGEVNKALNTGWESRAQIRLSPRVPQYPESRVWERFVRQEYPVRYLRIDPVAVPAYRKFLKGKYSTVDAYNSDNGTAFRSWDQIPLSAQAPPGGLSLVDWIEFLESGAPIRVVELRSPEILFREHLVRRHNTVENINRRLETNFETVSDIAPPWVENDLLELREHRSKIRTEFLVRNYRDVLQYIFLHGRALLNTAVLCIAMVLTALTVNPLCAYALSRFNLPATYKVLLFLLATMAFPAEVSAIPSFLLIKDLHLLGTYWAIILPSLANGYMIFLLKGFFDSLPQELFEAATIDGANEMQMFWNITIKLSKPVLAVIALTSFTHAYGSFMWAFLVLQEPKMWTLMVWLYQMQIWAPQFLVYAGLVLAAIPTLLVFIFCQNIIMRGIIIPSEK